MVFGPPQRIVDSLRPEETTMKVATICCGTRSVFDAGLVTIANEQEVAVGKIGERAVVLGASMGGLLAARVLADFYRTVAVIERDVLPDDPAQRRGVPQGQHVHALLSSGSQILGRLFPGLLDELFADGARLLDEGDLSGVSLRFGGHELDRSGKFADPARLVCYLASRPFLESYVRRRVSAIGNLTILDGHDVVELVAAVGADLALPQVPGRRSIPLRLSNWYTDRVLAAAESDTVVTEEFFRVMNLVDPPARLLHPSFLMRVAATNRRRREDKPTNPLPLKCFRRRDHEIAIGGGKLARRLTAVPHLGGSSDAARPSRDSFGHEMAEVLWPRHEVSVTSPAQRGRRR
jgi:hypothetical protein